MNENNIITTDAHGKIVLPKYAHTPDAWKFADNEYGITLFESDFKPFGLEFVIFLGWDDPQPHAELNPTGEHTFTEAETVYDVVYEVDDYRDWLKDCADAFDWVQTVDAERGIDMLFPQEALRRNTHEPKESDESEMDSMPFVWADAGMDCMIQGDVNTSVYEFTGGVGVDDLGVCAVTKRRYVTKTGQTRGMADETFLLDSGEDEIPAAGAYRVAAAIALAVAGMDNNRPTAKADTVDTLAGRIFAAAHDLI